MKELLSPQDLHTMRDAGKVAKSIINKLQYFIKPGISTGNIEEVFLQELNKHPGMEAAFKNYMGYPASCCVSLNDEIIHGIPSKRTIKDGDLVSVDLGIKYNGLFVDTAHTYIAGKVTMTGKKLVKTTFRCLQEGIRRAHVGSRIGDIGSAIQRVAEKKGFSVVRKFVGHGIGKNLHLPPEIPNFGEEGEGPKLEEGETIAIEPMIVAGNHDIDILDDGWTARTKDKSLSAHFEHTIAITKKGAWILTN